MDKTIEELKKVIHKHKIGAEDHKLLAHAIVCIYNTLMEMKGENNLPSRKDGKRK